MDREGGRERREERRRMERQGKNEKEREEVDVVRGRRLHGLHGSRSSCTPPFFGRWDRGTDLDSSAGLNIVCSYAQIV